jgi:hypothetical protein
MLAFIVPVKPKFNSKNWDKDNRLLDRTLKSLCNQTVSQFMVYVVYHDKPNAKFNHPSVKYIAYPFSYLPGAQIEDYENYAKRWYSSIKYAEYMFDKSKKITYGCKIAKNDGCSYIMAIDSDDLISNKIAAFVNSQGNLKSGWVVERGYVYVEGSAFLIKQKFFQHVNGSTHIVRADLVPIPDFNDNRLFNFNFFESHGYLRLRVQQFFKEDLEVLPFYGTVYTVNSNNTSEIKKLFNSTSVKTLLKLLLRGQWISGAIRDQFSIYRIA